MKRYGAHTKEGGFPKEIHLLSRLSSEGGVEVAHLQCAMGGLHVATHNALERIVGVLMGVKPRVTEFDQLGL